MNALKKKINQMTKQQCLEWYIKMYPETKVRRKVTVYREIIRRASKGR